MPKFKNLQFKIQPSLDCKMLFGITTEIGVCDKMHIQTLQEYPAF